MDEINLLDYIKILKHRWRTIAAVTLLAVLIAGVAVTVMPKIYEGETTLIFPKQTGDNLTSQIAALTGLSLPGWTGSFTGRDIYISVLKSRGMSQTVCAGLRGRDYDFDYEDLQDHLAVENTREGGLALTVSVPTSWIRSKSGREERAAELAADIANLYVDELIKYDKSNALSLGKKNRLYIEDQLANSRAELQIIEARLQRFREGNPTLASPESSSIYSEQAMGLISKQVEAEVALREAQAQLDAARSAWKNGAPQDISPEAVIDSPGISNLRAQLSEIEVHRAALLENLTADHPTVVTLTERIGAVRARLNSEIGKVVQGKSASSSPAHQELLKQLVLLQISRDGLTAQFSELSAAIERTESYLSKLPASQTEYVRLLRDFKAAETVYSTLMAEHARARVAEGRDADNFIVLDRASASDRPSSPRVKVIVFLALVAGMFAGVLFSMLGTGMHLKSSERRVDRKGQL